MMLIIGLTGNIASGKSTAASIFKKHGAEIIDADLIARQVVEKEKPAWKEIVKVFGKEILNDNGTLNRVKIGELVFKDDQNRILLTKITHPEILKEINKELEEFKRNNCKYVIIEAALIKESGALNKLIDKLIVVTSTKDNQIRRLKERNNYNDEEAELRIGAQIPIKQLTKYADYVISNDSDLNALNDKVNSIWNDLVSITRR